ncbi:MAG: hypothetical protein M3020_09780 [Myxococcota bacterium]|nr:hypothetical protein [Myxococcota bacterium]
MLRALMPLPVLLGLSYLAQRGGTLPEGVAVSKDRARSLAEALLFEGLVASPSEVHFVPAEPSRFDLLSSGVRERAVLLAGRPREPADVYLVEARRSREGRLIELGGVYNLTDTSAADEQRLTVRGRFAAWTIAQEGIVSSVQYADLRGEPPPSGRDWTRLRRLQNAITNLQETGHVCGVLRKSFRLEPQAFKVNVELSEQRLSIDADARRIVIPHGGPPSEGAEWVRDQTPPKPRPGNLATWAVDRVRALPWFGDDNLAFVKAVAFEGVDQLEQIVNNVTGDDGAAAVAEDLGGLYSVPPAVLTDPETGWPPPAMEPMLDPPLRGEGKWVSLENDPFVIKNIGAPSPFVFSFIRTDRKRIYSQVYVTLWDPRQVELDMVSGTVEPKSATGETGPGVVPRSPRVLSRFVGAFNGGFQAVHGEFGMMANRVVYLPPKPYGATVAKLDDGSTAFGTWPENTAIPNDVVSFRQNMTALVANDKINPYKRHWWGGVPPGWTEESRTVRSAICATREGFVGYFYGASVDPDVLGAAMVRAHCRYGVHLDMNPGHTGLEFYRVAKKGTLPKLKRPLDNVWEARGSLPDAPDWEFMARRMIRFMALMNFPRYVNPEARDFFYLTLRHLLPGEPAPTVFPEREEGEGAWRMHGLPQFGWPNAVATTNVRPDVSRPSTRVGLLKIDPKQVRLERADDAEPKRVVEFRFALASGGSALWLSPTRGFAIDPTAPEPSAQRITAGIPVGAPEAARAQAAIGIDEAGMLIYARLTEGPDPRRDSALLLDLLRRLRCDQVLLLPRPLGATLGASSAEKADASVTSAPETREDAQASATPSTLRVTLVRNEGPGLRSLFPDTPIVGPKTWAPMQQRRGASH